MNTDYIMILDTEYIHPQGLSTLFYDLSYYILKKDTLETAYKKTLLVKEFLGMTPWIKGSFYNKNRKDYEYMIEHSKNTDCYVGNYSEIIKIFIEDLKKVKEVYGYDCSADLKAINSTNQFFYRKPLNNLKKIQPCCIWNIACQTICTKDEYIQFCIDNFRFTKGRKNISTTAETVYSFIAQDKDFSQKHMALIDTYHEMIILDKSLNYAQEKNLQIAKGINKECWRVPNRIYHDNY